MSAPALRFEQVRVQRAGRLVLEVPALDLPAGGLQLVVGDNGAGKTTLLLAAAGLLDLQAGRIELFGSRFHRGRAPAPRALRRRIALALQDPFLFAGCVRDNVELGLCLRGIERGQRRRRADDLLARLGLARLTERKVAALSGGERKLVSLAAAAVLSPDLLLLDEPLAGLDEAARVRVLELLSEQVRERKASVLLATHQPEQIGALATGTVRVSAGQPVLTFQSTLDSGPASYYPHGS